MRPLSLVISTFFWSYFVLSSLVLWVGALLIFALTVGFDRRRKLLHLYSSAWAYHYLLLLPRCRTHFEGHENIDPGQTYVLVANHQSLFDIPLLYGLFAHFKWVSKQEIFRTPFIGWNMSLNGYVPFRRGDRRSSAEVLRRCQEHLTEGSSVLLFPEGTRSADGELRPFSKGPVSLARRAGVKLLPIVLDGTRDLLPKQSFVFDISSPRILHVRVLEPIDLSGSDPREATNALRQLMSSELETLRSAEQSPPSSDKPAGALLRARG